MFEKVKKSGMSEMDKNAKMSVLKNLRGMANEAMKKNLEGSGVKKVSVMSDSEEGLEKGLEKAKEIVEQPEDSEDASEGGDKMSEMMEYAKSCSSEELDKMIEMLNSLKEEKSSEGKDDDSISSGPGSF